MCVYDAVSLSPRPLLAGAWNRVQLRTITTIPPPSSSSSVIRSQLRDKLCSGHGPETGNCSPIFAPSLRCKEILCRQMFPRGESPTVLLDRPVFANFEQRELDGKQRLFSFSNSSFLPSPIFPREDFSAVGKRVVFSRV